MKPARVKVEPHTGPSTSHEISSEETLLGRGLSADVQLTDRGASRDHAMIMWEGDHFEIEDLQTTNGTRLNGKRVRSSALTDGDVIEIGHSRIIFHTD
ncbi:MAG: FHA domain-containing protein [Deltaproteobacteria bacterium]|nr:FHA domain-containing protein [Deltaproteobacteria bacterium]MBW2415566.1 FHA domain-containing protein [Deltaproteobacteria bacterium]